MEENAFEKKLTVTNVFLALAIVLFIISLAVVITLNFRPLYYFDITYLDIPETSGYSEPVIRENYDALIDYNSVFYTGRLEFPSMPMSDTGEIHFEEVKVIFSVLQIMAIVLLPIVTVAIIWKLRKRQYYFLRLSAYLSILLPLVLGLLIMLNWDRFFTLFHQIFFNNDYWIFNSQTDPVITILPDAFFMHCAFLILVIVILFAAAMWITHSLLVKKFHKNSASNTVP